MSSNNKIETIIGSAIILVALGFFIFTYKVADVKKFSDTYPLKAVFEQVEGIIVGSDVMLSGIKIGSVADLKLDTSTYRAAMVIGIKREVKIPNDSSIAIVSNGLLGKKYVSINAGGSEEMFADGDEIRFTQSSVNLETLIGKMIFNGAGQEKKPAANQR